MACDFWKVKLFSFILTKRKNLFILDLDKFLGAPNNQILMNRKLFLGQNIEGFKEAMALPGRVNEKKKQQRDIFKRIC